jgi:hypothetical protein
VLLRNNNAPQMSLCSARKDGWVFFQGEQVTRAEASNKSYPSKAQAREWRNLTVATL